MAGKKLKNISKADNVIICKSEEKSIGSEGYEFLQVLGSTLEMSSSNDLGNPPDVTVAIPLVSKALPLTNISIHIPTLTSIIVPQVWHKKTQVGKGKDKGKGKPTYKTKY